MFRIKIFQLIALSLFTTVVFSQGDLLVTPKRIVFEGKKQKEELNLVNIGKDTVTYNVSFLHYDMKEDGSFKIVNTPSEKHSIAEPYLRLFPRKVTLAPNEPQVVMLQYRRKADMADGEYRSHLYFRAEKENTPLGQQKKLKDSTLLGVQLIPVYGISIPVIIRTGMTDVKASISDLKLKKNEKLEPTIEFKINRSGNISLYGDIRVQFIPSKGGAFDIANMKGVGIYTNLDKRNIIVRLDKDKVKDLKSGKLKVTYSSSGEGKTVVYAESELSI
jgi:hypothetical protein